MRSTCKFGTRPVLIWKGEYPVTLCCDALYANSVRGRSSSQVAVCSWIRQRSRFPRERLVTSVWPSVWGWNAVENWSVVPIKRHRVREKLLVNRTSRSEMMLRGTP